MQQRLSNFSIFNVDNTTKRVYHDLFETGEDTDLYHFGIVCVHDLLFNRSIFTELAEHLSQLASVVSLDLPGHGGSDWLSEYNLEAYLGSCISVINTCNFKRLVWIGHGLGGLIGVKLAAMANSPIVGLVLDTEEMNLDYKKLRSPMMGIVSNSLGEIAANLETYLQEGVTLSERMKFAVRNFELIDGQFRSNYDPHLERLEEVVDLTSAWNTIKQPILLLNDSDSHSLDLHKLNNSEMSMSKKSKLNPITRYSNEDKELILWWIQSIVQNHLVRNHFAIAVG
jgi:pimeloyl-ACP methyl ester carboxylesterase